MVAGVWRVVASAAEARDAFLIECVVQSGHAGDVDIGVVEQLLSARSHCARRYSGPGHFRLLAEDDLKALERDRQMRAALVRRHGRISSTMTVRVVASIFTAGFGTEQDVQR